MKIPSKVVLSILFIILAIFLISDVSAVSSWKKFGGDAIIIKQSDFIGTTSRFDLNVSSILLAVPNIVETRNLNSYQPVVATISDKNYLFLQNANYIQIYDGFLNLVGEELTGSLIGQNSLTNFDGDGINNDLVGLYRNSTNFSNIVFKVYNFDNSFVSNLTYNFQISLTHPLNSSGVRCISQNCYAFLSENNGLNKTHYLLNVFRNATSLNYSITSFDITATTRNLLEPPNWADADNDGLDEFLGFSEDTIYYINEGGTTKFTGFTSLGSAKFIDNDASSQLRIVATDDTLSTCGLGNNNCAFIHMFRIDGTTIWTKQTAGQTTGDFAKFMATAIADYNKDGFDDIFTIANSNPANQYSRFQVYDGRNGNLLYNENSPTIFTNNVYRDRSLTLADLNNDGVSDFIFRNGNNFYLYNTLNKSFFISSTSTGLKSCIPADYNYDNLIDVICSGTTQTLILTSNYTNQNSVINSIAFDPSTSILTSQLLTAIISASDPEGDFIFYSIKCSNEDNFSVENNNPSQTCTYLTAGNYNLSVRVRDFFHSDYDTFSQNILVTSSGTTCNFNSICENTEDYLSCPSDCSAPQEQTPVFSSEGGVSIPYELVNTQNIEQGFLPEIYLGTMAFMSYTLIPFLVIIFTIIAGLVILTIAKIIMKFAKG